MKKALQRPSLRLLLVVPPRPQDQILNLIPPYNLGYLATACLQSGFTVQILDCPLEKWDHSALLAWVRRENPDVVGFTMFTTDHPAVALACRLLKQLPAPPVTLLGGIQPSSFPQQTLCAIPDADYLFAGEAETSLPRLLTLLQSGNPSPDALRQVPGLGWRESGAVVLNPRSAPSDLDSLGTPAWHLLSPLRYQSYPPTLFVRQRPYAPIITSRGCPHACTFCAGYNVTGRSLRERSLPLIFDEIGFLRDRFGIRELHIEDDNFSWRRERVLLFCEEMLRRNWKMTWTMPNGVRLDTLDLELLRLMKRAGCYFLVLGVESGSDRILQHMRKKITVRQVEEKVALVHQAGILPHAFFMLGYPEETADDIQATLDLALRLPLIGAHFSAYRPLPGTESARQLVARGEIDAFNFSAQQSTFASVLYAPPGMNCAQIKKWQKKMLASFYFRPRILWRYFREVLRHPPLALGLLRRAILYLLKS